MVFYVLLHSLDITEVLLDGGGVDDSAGGARVDGEDSGEGGRGAFGSGGEGEGSGESSDNGQGSSDDSTMSDEEFEEFSNSILNGTDLSGGSDDTPTGGGGIDVQNFDEFRILAANFSCEGGWERCDQYYYFW